MIDPKIGTPKDSSGLRKGMWATILPAIVFWLALGFVIYLILGSI